MSSKTIVTIGVVSAAVWVAAVAVLLFVAGVEADETGRSMTVFPYLAALGIGLGVITLGTAVALVLQALLERRTPVPGP